MSKHTGVKEKNVFCESSRHRSGHVAFLVITFSNNFVKNLLEVKERILPVNNVIQPVNKVIQPVNKVPLESPRLQTDAIVSSNV
jgi:hypothetical protein